MTLSSFSFLSTFTPFENSFLNLGTLFLALSIIYITCNEVIRLYARIPKFGGPPGFPLVGNIWQIRGNASELYRQWAMKYGAVYQIQLGNIPIIVVNSAVAARVIFGQNSQALSSRPEFYTFHKILSDTSGTTIGTSPYSDSLKRRRKGAAAALNRPSVTSYTKHLDIETRTFVSEALINGNAGKTPVDPLPMIQRLSLSLALTLNWGTRLQSQDSALFHEIIAVEAEVSKFRSTTGNLQDYIPILRLNPFNFGSKKAKEMRRRRDVYLKSLNDGLDERMEKGIHEPCIQANVIMDEEASLNKAELVSISLTMLSGGLDTVTTLVTWSVALLAQRTDLQERAFDEIVKLHSAERPLCDPEDDQKCAYVVALVRECLRYFTVIRLSLPRASIKDIIYEGKVIPKGSVVFLNAWACNMDEEVWDDPELFRPERFLEQPEAPMFTYGIGYRMCTGTLLANRELYLIFMRTIASFKISKLDDVDTNPVTGISDKEALAYAPGDYKVIFEPRDEALLRDALGAVKEKC